MTNIEGVFHSFISNIVPLIAQAFSSRQSLYLLRTKNSPSPKLEALARPLLRCFQGELSWGCVELRMRWVDDVLQAQVCGFRNPVCGLWAELKIVKLQGKSIAHLQPLQYNVFKKAAGKIQFPGREWLNDWECKVYCQVLSLMTSHFIIFC